MRAKALINLLDSVNIQTLYPNEILIIDGSTNDETQDVLKNNLFKNLNYYKVKEENRGLTKQRNFGISKLNSSTEIVCFLDDDTYLDADYFEKIIENFIKYPNAAGIGGIAKNENNWKINNFNYKKNLKIYTLENYYIKESTRNYVRNIIGLNSNELPNIMPKYSHGITYNYPINTKSYPVDLIVGMSMNFRKNIFDKIKFSTYFEGYGLYEDADFSIRALQFGQNYIATSALLNHFHDASGRPNQYKYGKMVIRNGWYVWRVKYPNPKLIDKIKWNLISFLLTFIRFTNAFTTNKKKEAFTESVGRTIGWFSLIFNKPKIE